MKAIEHTPTRQGQETQLPLMLEMPRGIFARIRELVRRSLDRELHAQMLLHDLPLLFDTERLEQRLRPLLTRAKEGQSVRIPATILSPFVKSGLPPKAARIARAIPKRWSTIVIPIQDGKFLFGAQGQISDGFLRLECYSWH